MYSPNKFLNIAGITIIMLTLTGCTFLGVLPMPTPSLTSTATTTVTITPTATYTMTPPPTITSTPIFPTIDVFEGEWKNIDPRTKGWTKVIISIGGKNRDRIIGQVWGKCHPRDCYVGKTTTIYKGNPVELLYDKGYFKYFMVLFLDNGILHVTTSRYGVDEQGNISEEPDYISEYDFQK